MMEFARYPHIQDLLRHYAEQENRNDIISLMKNNVTNESDSETFSRFVWHVAELVNNDEENAVEVLGSTDNTEMLPDLNYEVSTYMRAIGYYPVWQRVSDQEMQ